ncbi:hypothetical protein I316_00068 [Kwoniella heveanensis BCC8398]|uniref:Peroxisomal membrane protein PEX16 n=1 Tax=Kwoniella heveanensis BCC8398 TaxID=1296120 RepID=A0A1B9H3I7_9TREE|nr:hypothetical protein I316_00068 [Kwoniella heveanensis BCC8398]
MSPLSAYHQLLLSNLSTVQTIESGLSNVTWLLPGRFEDAELASEGLYALLNVVSGYHDSILHAHLPNSLSLPPHPFASTSTRHASDQSQPASGSAGESSTQASSPPPPNINRTYPLLPPASDHARYTRYWTNRSLAYGRASRALTTIGYLELVIEMLAKRKGGDRARWRVVLVIESIKTFLRLLILRITKRPVLFNPSPQREVDPSTLPPEILNSNSNSLSSSSLINNTSLVDQQEGLKPQPLSPSIAPHAPLRSHLYPMLSNMPESHLVHPLNLVQKLKGKKEYVSEIIWSSVGLIHVLLLMKAGRKSPDTYKPLSLATLSRSYAPYLLILRLLLLARYLRPKPSSSVASPLILAHQATQDKKLLARAFLTGPMWLGFTRPKVQGIASGLARVPVMGLVGELVQGYLPLVDDYFYCE